MLKSKTINAYLATAMAGGAFAATYIICASLLRLAVDTSNPELLNGIISLALGLPILILIMLTSFALATAVAFIILLKCNVTSKIYLVLFGSILSAVLGITIILELAPLGHYIPQALAVVASIASFTLVHATRTIPALFRTIILITLSVLIIVFTYQSQDPLKTEKVQRDVIRQASYTLLAPPKNGYKTSVWYIEPYGKTFGDGARLKLMFDRVMLSDADSLIELNAPNESPKPDCSNGYLILQDEKTGNFACTLISETNGIKVYQQQQETYAFTDGQYNVKHTYFAVANGTLIKTLFSRTVVYDSQRVLLSQPKDLDRSKETQQALLTSLQPINDNDLLDMLRLAH